MKPEPFDQIAGIIDSATAPFPVSEVRLLIFQATARARVTRDLARALGRFHITIAMLAEMIELDGDNARPKRNEAIDDLACLRKMCQRRLQ